MEQELTLNTDTADAAANEVVSAPADNFFARSARGMADSYGKTAEVGADLSRLR